MAQNKINFQIDFKKGDITALNSLKQDIAEIQRLAGDLDFTGFMKPTEIQGMVKAAKTLESALDQAFDVNLNTVNVQKFNNLLRQSGYNAETLQADLANAGITGQQAFLKATGQLMQFNTATKQTNKFLDNIATSLGNTIKWSLMSSVVNNISSTVQKSYYYVKDLDRALNDIRIVTGKSAEDMELFAESANNAAKSLGVTTENYTQGSLIYYQQGLDDETVKTLTDITAKTSNVTGQAMSTVSEQLTAVWNGYQVANQAAEEGMQVYEQYVDKLAAVGATTASDLEELSTAMSKVASAASSMGVGFDDLNAQIATIVSVTRQAPESVGTALKTIYARLGDLKVDGVDEFGTKLGEVSSQLKTMGIDIVDTNGDMRDMSDVMADVAKKWNEWTSAQRQAAAIAMAGKRQYNNLVALFDNWDMYGEALETSMNAAGTLEEQQAIAMESLAKKMDVLKTTAEDLYKSLFNTDTITNWVEKGTEALQFLTDISDAVGGLNNILPMLGSIGLQVFSEQIGRGLSTIVINARNAIQETQMMKDNFEQIKAMYSDSSVFSYDPESAAVAQAIEEETGKIYAYYEKMYPYQSMMSQEQKEQYNNIMNQKVALASEKVELVKAAENWEKIGDQFKIIDPALVKNLDDIRLFATETTKVNAIVEELESMLAHIGQGLEKDTIQDRLSQLEGVGKNSAKWMAGAWEGYFKQTKSASEATDKLIKQLKDVGNTVGNLAKANTSIASTANTINSLEQSLSGDLHLESTIQNVSRFAGSVGQLVTSFSMLKESMKLLDEEGVSLDQVIGRIATSFGIMLSSIATVVPNITKGFDLLKTGFNEISHLQESFAARRLLIAKEEGVLAQLKVAQEEKVAMVNALVTKSQKEQLNAALGLMATEKLNITVVNEETKAKVKETLASRGMKIEDESLVGAITASIVAENIETGAIELNTKAKIANTLATHGWAIALIAIPALILGVAIAIKKAAAAEGERRVAAINARAEEQKAFEEAHDARKKEIEEQQELAQSYIDLYNKYKKGNVEKEAMIEKTNSLVEILGQEAVAVANLTGDYEALNNQLLEYRANKIGEKIQQNTEETETNRDTIRATQENTSGLSKYYTNNAFKELYDNLTEEQQKMFKLVEGYDSVYQLDLSGDFSGQDLQSVLTQLREAGYITVNDISAVLDPMENIIKAEKETALLKISQELAKTDKISEVNNYEDFNKILDETIEKLGETAQYQGADYQAKFEKAIQMISELGGNEDDILRAQATNSLVQKYGEDKAKEITNKVQNLSTRDLSILLKINLDWDTFNNNLNEILHDGQLVADHNAIDVRINAINSIKEGIASGEIKEEVRQELQESFSGLDIDWEQFWTDFDASTPLEQVNKLNELIEKTNDNLYNTDKTIEEIDEEGINLKKADLTEQLNKAKEVVRQRSAGNSYISVEEVEEATKKIKELTDQLAELESKEAYTIEIDYNDTALNLFTNNVNGILSMAENAKSAAELIGEGFIVAAEDAEELFKVYPALQDAAEVLANGDIQLNQQVVDTILSGNMDIIESNTEVADQQLQQQIDMLQAQIDYNKSKMQALSDYLAGEKTAQETEDAINEAGAKYEADLENAVGKTAVDNAKAALDANNQATNGVLLNLDKIGERANALGQALAKALAGEAANYTPGGGGDAGGSVSDYSGYTTTAIDEVRKENSDYAAKAEAEMQRLMSETTDLTKQLANAQLLQSKLRAGSKESLDSLRGAASGKGGKIDKDKSGGGSDKDKKKDLKELDEEFDRYWQIKKAIDMLDLSISRLEKDQKNLHGKELIASLKRENELLAEQKGNYEALYKMQQQEQAELQAQLSGSGVIFDASGAITNYAQATAAALAQYTAAVNAYNAGLIDDTAFEVQEKAYENFKKTLERYEALYYKEMQDTQDKIDDARRKQLENNLKAWETEIQIKLDLQEAEREWQDFLKDINEDFQSVFKDLSTDMDTLLKKSKTYTGKNGKDGTIGTDIAAIQDVMKEIDKMKNGGESSMFESISQAQEKLKELQKKLQDDAKAMRDLWKEGWETYLEEIDQVADKFEALQKRFSDINNQIKFYSDYVKLVFGEKAYKALDKIYKAQEKATKNQMIAAKREADMWKEQFEKSGADINDPTKWTKDQQEFYENWISAQENVNDLALEYVQILQEDYSNTINEIYDGLRENLYGVSLQNMADEWERISYYSDHYLDNIEKSYEAQKLANRIDQDIAKTSNLKTQQKLQEFRDKYIQQLRETKDLTQYEVDATEAKYQILLKEAALEDSMNNKTTMKMTRNEQGNWSYQYVADDDDTASKRQELLDSYNELYQLATKAYQENLEAAQQLTEDYLTKKQEIDADTTLSQEIKNQKLLELDTWYSEESARLAEKTQTIKNDLQTAGAGLLLEIYEQDEEAVAGMTEAELGLIQTAQEAKIEGYMDLEKAVKSNYDEMGKKSNEVMKQTQGEWIATANNIIDAWSKDDGKSVKDKLSQATKDIQKAFENYQAKVKQCSDLIDFDLDDLDSKLNGLTGDTDKLKDKTNELAKESTDGLDEMRAAVDALKDAWDSVKNSIMETIEKLKEYLDLEGKGSASGGNSGGTGGGAGGTGGTTGGGSGSGSGGGTTGGSTGGNGTKEDLTGYYKWYPREGGTHFFDSLEKAKNARGNKGGAIMGPYTDSQCTTPKKNVKTFATGGYTGDWNDAYGRMALLHQKELVLNKEDTSNFLKGISLLRDMTALNGSISGAISNAVMGMAMNLGNISPGTYSGNTTTETNNAGDVFNITAEFPNANDVNEIREAILSLPRLASQYIGRNIK